MDSESRRFDEELHDNLERFFVALYDAKIIGDLEKWVDSTKQDAIAFSSWIRSQSNAGRSHADLESAATTRRAELKAAIDGVRATLAQIIPAETPNYPGSRHWDAIRDLEDKVLQARFSHLIAEPLLEDFDARVDEALDR